MGSIVSLATLALFLIGGILAGCSDETEVRDLWKTLPHPDDIVLNGSIQQIATALSGSVELPTGYGWTWEHVERDWDGDHPLIELRHDLPLNPHGVPGDGGLPGEIIDLIDEMSWPLAFEDFDRYGAQGHRVILLYIGPDPKPESNCVTVAFLVDVRLVTGGGQEEERWEVRQVTPLSACPDD